MIQGNYVYKTIVTPSGSRITKPIFTVEKIEITPEINLIPLNQIVNISLVFQRFNLENGQYETIQPEGNITLTCQGQSEELTPVDGVATTQFQSAEPGTFNLQARCGNAWGEVEVVVE